MLHSCIKEIIMSALSRFAQMEMIEETAYLTKKGNSTMFIRCPSESGPKL